ncbi:MAG: hypothetical protein P8008_06925 [Gammaproteobacteria bacterium]
MTLDEARADLALKTCRGIGMPLAGLLYWITVSLLVQSLPMQTALLWSFIATGAVFPVGLLFTRLYGGDLINKGHELNGLGGLFNAVQAFYWPVLILVFYLAPGWTLFTMVVLFCSHFMGYAWLYRSRAYWVLAIAGPVAAIALGLLIGEETHLALPPVTAAVYAVASAMLLTETRATGTGAAA